MLHGQMQQTEIVLVFASLGHYLLLPDYIVPLQGQFGILGVATENQHGSLLVEGSHVHVTGNASISSPEKGHITLEL